MIENEFELRHSIKTLAKMYAMREKEAVEPSWSEDLREQVLHGTDAMIRKIERQVADYFVAQRQRADEAAEPQPNDEAAANGRATPSELAEAAV